MVDNGVLTSASHSCGRDTKYYSFGNAAVPRQRSTPPTATPRDNSFIMRVEEVRVIVRVTYFFDPHPTKPDWYLVDLVIGGLDNYNQCFEVLLCANACYDTEFGNHYGRRDFLIRARNHSNPKFIDVAAHAMGEIIPIIFENDSEETGQWQRE